jgi:hypothetical protein
MHNWCYTYAGLRISSELELPEWRPFGTTALFAEPDVTILLGPALRDNSPSLLADPIISPDEYQFLVPEIGAFRVTCGSKIVVSPAATAGENELRLFLLGSAWGALCYQRGLFAVHASAVCTEGGAVLFCALPGKGKSTMTAFLAAAGCGLVSDDLCCIDMSSRGTPLVHPSSQRFRLWKDALEVLGWATDTLERDHFRFDKFLLPCEQPPAPAPGPVALRAIYLLEWGEPQLVRLQGLNALHRFVAAGVYRGELLEKMGLSGAYWQRCLELLQKVPVWELTRPQDLAIMADTVAMLQSHWNCAFDEMSSCCKAV